MKYIFRGITVFEYRPDDKYDKVIEHTRAGYSGPDCPTFNFCKMIPEDYRLLAQFFDTVYRHTQGEDVELKDIEVY